MRAWFACALLLLLVGCERSAPEPKVWMGEGADAELPSPAELASLDGFHGRSLGADRIFSLHFPASLQELNLSDNRLPALPGDLVPTGIRRLWLTKNSLTTLPAELSGWTQLEYLNLDNNLLKEVPDLSRTALRWLRLNSNRLTTLPALPESIERLYLADNQLTEAPRKPVALKHLVLAGNPITSVPDDLGAGLEWLDLSRTQVFQLPADLSAWRTLKVLNLSRCPLSDAERRRVRAAFDDFSTTVLL